jgi:hypothetical protein
MSTITHAEATHKIYFTRDLARFKSITGNRLLNESKINRIIKDITNGLDLLKYCPIIVDKEMNVIDGQHRLYVAKKMKSNIWYVISEKLSLHEIAKINSNTERWKPQDFIHCYSAQGNENYKILENYMDTYGFPLSVSLKILRDGNVIDAGDTGSPKEDFESGNFKVNHLKKANELGDLVAKFHHHKGYTARGFICAIYTLKQAGKCDFDHLRKKMETTAFPLKDCTNMKSYLVRIEELYNKGAQTRKVIF